MYMSTYREKSETSTVHDFTKKEKYLFSLGEVHTSDSPFIEW